MYDSVFYALHSRRNEFFPTGKNKYLQNCLEMRKDFTPMVYSVNGIAGREARNAEKRLATHLAGWQVES